ncbi:MAG: AraC family transcriptional regulator [Verrucomicrobiales bacterium]|nr:AraC family transcriptional regulator [Verrucomicrobiales bacterium]
MNRSVVFPPDVLYSAEASPNAPISEPHPSRVVLWTHIARHCQFKLGAVVKHCGVTRRQVDRWCQADLGRSPGNWLAEQRMIAASILLREKTIKEAAFDLGFRQVSHFSRAFKACFGLTPATYQDRFKRREPSTIRDLETVGDFKVNVTIG